MESTRFVNDGNWTTLNEAIFDPYGNRELIDSYKLNGDKQCYYQYATHLKTDDDVEMVYAKGRYYLSEEGIFASTDPMQQTLSLYSYCGNNPTSNVDETGYNYSSDYFMRTYFPDYYYTSYTDYSNYQDYYYNDTTYYDDYYNNNYYNSNNYGYSFYNAFYEEPEVYVERRILDDMKLYQDIDAGYGLHYTYGDNDIDYLNTMIDNDYLQIMDDFSYGFTKTVAENSIYVPESIKPQPRNSNAYKFGLLTGNVASLGQASYEMLKGVTIATAGLALFGGGTAADVTGIGALVGVPAQVLGVAAVAAGVGIVSHGTVVGANAGKNLFSMKGEGGGGNGYYPAPKEIKGIKELTRAKPKTPVQGGGGLRKRWKDPKGNIYEWDSRHGELEMYNSKGDHLGAFDPVTGKQLKHRDPSRNIKKFL